MKLPALRPNRILPAFAIGLALLFAVLIGVIYVSIKLIQVLGFLLLWGLAALFIWRAVKRRDEPHRDY
jgi:membrane protein implicated in regulation of membrane protease activity